MNTKIKKYSIGILGVRGYVGQELLAIIAHHPMLSLNWVSSRQLAGQPVSAICSNYCDKEPLLIESLSPENVAAKNTDIVVLALPNGLAFEYVKALELSGNQQIIIDLSADYRFNPDWHYLVPEINNLKQGKQLGQSIKISNPGCYATAMQLAIAPIKDLLATRPNCFGVSGYSGAGTTPNPNNDMQRLTDNLVAYKTVEHLHEKEVTRHLDMEISFTPHVSQFFRGINMTIQLEFNFPVAKSVIENRFVDYYSMHPLVEYQESIPTLKEVVNTPKAVIGGLTISQDRKRGTIICCLDNLLKGAASQAIQNINLAIGQHSTLGLVDSFEFNPLIAKQDLNVALAGAKQ